MTTDKELLELAAKAAGIRGEATDYGFKQDNGGPEENPMWILWNPLIDDGDALRLAVKLNILWKDSVHFIHHLDLEEQAKDPYSATRHAIVRAAAEIGRNIK